jgi:ABC-type Co2+ transport system permease subunit
MHIPDGFLPPAIAIGGYGLTGASVWFCLRQIRHKRVGVGLPETYQEYA